MTKDEALKKAFKQAFQLGQDYWYQADHEYESQNKKSDVTRAKFEQLMEDAIKEALAQPEQEPVACVYKATTKKGETAHFGEYSAAKAWAGWGTVEQVPLKTLTLIQKSIQPCSTCEALSRAVMLDQTSHDNFKPDWDTQAVLVEEQQRMAKRIEDLEAMLERQTARIVGLQDEIRNLTGEE